jgi:hypothetical protein
MMELEWLNQREFVWVDTELDIEIHVTSCDSKKVAQERLKIFIDKIRKIKEIKIID